MFDSARAPSTEHSDMLRALATRPSFPVIRMQRCIVGSLVHAVQPLLCSSVRYTSKRAMSRRYGLVFPLALFCTVSAWAVDPDRRISQYAHTAWRTQDGFFTGVPWAVAQTKDGYLWVGTTSGLFRFDGVRFTSWNANVQLHSREVMTLLGAGDGSLWIGTPTGSEPLEGSENYKLFRRPRRHRRHYGGRSRKDLV